MNEQSLGPLNRGTEKCADEAFAPLTSVSALVRRPHCLAKRASPVHIWIRSRRISISKPVIRRMASREAASLSRLLASRTSTFLSPAVSRLHQFKVQG